MRTPRKTPLRLASAEPHPAANFDRIAGSYRWLEYLSLGPLLARCRRRFLAALEHRRNALILGDGDGRFLAALLKRNRSLHATAVDLSPAMLRLLTQRCDPAVGRLDIHHADALAFVQTHHGTQRYDLVVTHFFLDCLGQSEVDDLVRAITPQLATGALWVISDFRLPPGPLALPARAFVRSLYLAFRLLTGLRVTHLPHHQAPLRQMGFTLQQQHRSFFGLLTSELWHLPDRAHLTP